MEKLGVIVPYRDRPEQLDIFRKHISEYLYKRGIHHEIIIVEQLDDRPFNRGMLLNWGFRKAEWANCNYVVFHDIDLLPIDIDYSKSEFPIQLVTEIETEGTEDEQLFYDYFGGVTLFNMEDFKTINGYSNDYWGWGFEDDDLFRRCIEKGIKTDFKKFIQKRQSGVGLRFNGHNSLVALPNSVKNFNNYSIVGSFTVDNITPKLEEEFDELTIFSFSSPDTCLSYRSFMNFNMQLWDKELNPFSIYSKKYPLGSYNFCVTFEKISNDYSVKVYINGELIGEKLIPNLKRNDNTFIYLGVGNPDRKEKPNFFEGLINNFALYSKTLNEEEVKEIGLDSIHSLFYYRSSSSLVSYYDSKYVMGNKLIDLCGKFPGMVKNCTQELITQVDDRDEPIPFRRKGRFKALPHTHNGFTDTWVDWSSRVNQSKYFEFIRTKKTKLEENGLSTYWGELTDEFTEANYNHLYITT